MEYRRFSTHTGILAKRDSPFVKLLVNLDNLRALIRLNGVPWCRVGLGPDDYRPSLKHGVPSKGRPLTSRASSEALQVPSSSDEDTSDDSVTEIYG